MSLFLPVMASTMVMKLVVVGSYDARGTPCQSCLVLSCLALSCLVLPCLVCLTLSITINSPAQNSRQARRASMPPVPNAKAPWLQLARQTASRRMSVALLASISCKRTILGRAIQPPVNPPGAEAPLERSRTAAMIHLPRRASVGPTRSVSLFFFSMTF